MASWAAFSRGWFLGRLRLVGGAAPAVTAVAVAGCATTCFTCATVALPPRSGTILAHRRDAVRCEAAASAASTSAACAPSFFFCGKTETHTPVFEARPSANTASVNVNGMLLRNYARSMGNVGMKEDVYDRLYSALLREACASPGQLQPATRASSESALCDLGLTCAFARILPESASAQTVVGAVFIDVYAPQYRPMGSAKNVALLFVEGPIGRRDAGPSGVVQGRRPVFTDRAEFLEAVESMASNVMLAIREYNDLSDRTKGQLPQVQILQFPLVSGGPTRHPDASKLDVAVAIIKGLRAGGLNDSIAVSAPLSVRLAYDEDVFRQAAQAIGDL